MPVLSNSILLVRLPSGARAVYEVQPAAINTRKPQGTDRHLLPICVGNGGMLPTGETYAEN